MDPRLRAGLPSSREAGQDAHRPAYPSVTITARRGSEILGFSRLRACVWSKPGGLLAWAKWLILGSLKCDGKEELLCLEVQ